MAENVVGPVDGAQIVCEGGTRPEAADFEQARELLAARAAFYRMIASLYYKELDEDGLAHLRAVGLRGLRLGVSGVDEGLEAMAAFLEQAGGNARQQLAVDFAGAFLGAGAYDERRATPYESVFTSEAGLLMQEARDDVYRFYCERSVAPDPALQMPEDHLSFECEFMATLAERAVEALAAGDAAEAARLTEVQRRFHQSHLLNWVDAYCDCLDKCAGTRFYRGVSQITRGFVHEDEAMLAELEAALSV